MLKYIPFFTKKKTYQMDISSANETLQNVFANCEKEPNTIPFDKLLLRQKANTVSVSIGKIICLFMLFLLITIPIATIRMPAHLVDLSGASSIKIESHYVENGILYLAVIGGNLDTNKCYAITEDGTPILPTYVTTNFVCVSFPFVDGTLNIFLFDLNGNSIHLIVTSR